MLAYFAFLFSVRIIDSASSFEYRSASAFVAKALLYRSLVDGFLDSAGFISRFCCIGFSAYDYTLVALRWTLGDVGHGLHKLQCFFFGKDALGC
jgi:hypothetical protein